MTFLTVMPSPYVQDLFSALSVDARVDLTVWYLEQEAPNTHWGIQPMPPYARVLPGRWIGGGNTRIHYNPGIRRLLKTSDADLFVIVGYIGLTNQIAMRTLSRRKRRWAFWGEVPGLYSRGRLGSAIRTLLQRPLRDAVGIAGVGTRAVASYRDMVPADGGGEPVFANIPYTCDTAPYAAASANRQRSEGVRFLYCGQMVDRKGVDLLCQAFAGLVDQGLQVELSMVGRGPMDGQLRSMLPADAAARVHFHGFQKVDGLPGLFAQSDVFVMPSRYDGWAVVVNQAVASGMPVIATDAVGAAHDLVVPGHNGFRVAADSVSALSDAMRSMAEHPEQIESMGRASSAMAQKIAMPTAVQDWVHFFGDCIGNTGRRNPLRTDLTGQTTPASRSEHGHHLLGG